MEPVPFPEFDELSPAAQERMSGLAARFRIPPQKALMLTMLIAQGIAKRQLIDACRMMELPLRMSDLSAMRKEMAGWMILEQQRQSIIERLERANLLTQEIYDRLLAARERMELVALYFEAEPFVPLEGEMVNGDGLLDGFNWLAMLKSRVKPRYFFGAGDL